MSNACSPSSSIPGDGDADGDSDGDGDTDADTDADSDADGDSDGDADGDSDADHDEDADEPVCTDAEFGERCESQSDCCPGLVCFSPPEDSRPSICTYWCEDDCPEGWACGVFNDGSGGEARVCWYPEDTLCNSCDENTECGEVRDLCIGIPGPEDDTYCSIYCEPSDPDSCPDGFSCVEIEAEISTYQCRPDNDICCIDADEDGYGRGGMCAGLDCNDHNPAVNPGAEEVCDGVDNDCDGGIDNAPDACGTCWRCVDGACQEVPEGEDPREECPGVDCDLYYWGWEEASHTCYRMGDVPDTLAACDGAGSCRTAEVECNLHRIQGPSSTRCEGTIGVCQEVSGCDATTEGNCVDLDLGTLTCGVGECANSVEHCIAGVEQTCIPRGSSPEACDDLDNDCDGEIDIAATFAVHPDEPNESCADPSELGDIAAPATGVAVPHSPTIYPGDDDDYYVFTAIEPTDSFLDCLPLLCQENYRVTFTIDRPDDGSDYQLCASADSCSGQTCTSSTTRVVNYIGTCGPTDDRDIYFSVRSGGADSFDCHGYNVTITFEAWLSTAPGSIFDCPGA